MFNEQELTKLRDIHLPEAINSWWPIAIGLQVMVVFLIIGLIIGLIWIYYVYKHSSAKRYALKKVRVLKKQYDQGMSIQPISMEISLLLRHCAQIYFPQSNIYSLHGQAWIDFLNSTSHGLNFNDIAYEISILPYQESAQSPSEHHKLLLIQVQQWLRQRGYHV